MATRERLRRLFSRNSDNATARPISLFPEGRNGSLPETSDRMSLEEDHTARLTEIDYDRISDELVGQGREEWAKRPRTYSILKSLDLLETMDMFVEQEIYDISIPHSRATLPKLGSKTAKDRFIDAQVNFLSHPDDFVREPRTHKHLDSEENEDEDHYKSLKQLGEGGYGFVDLVQAPFQKQKLARKRIPRGRNNSQEKSILSEFRTELQALKKIDFRHSVEFVGSYTDVDHIGILMLPVAKENLEEYLDFAGVTITAWRQGKFDQKIIDSILISLYASFGCLAGALTYLHQNNIRHRDLKPRNVLVHKGRMLVTDFGLAKEWEEGHGSTTMHRSAANTPAYCSPEQADHKPRNRKSDVWSLGCIFLEIMTVCTGHTVKGHMGPFFAANGTGSPFIRTNTVATASYISMLQTEAMNESSTSILRLITRMLKVKSEERPSAEAVFRKLAATSIVYACSSCTIDGAKSQLNSLVEPVSMLQLFTKAPEELKWKVFAMQETADPGIHPEYLVNIMNVWDGRLRVTRLGGIFAQIMHTKRARKRWSLAVKRGKILARMSNPDVFLAITLILRFKRICQSRINARQFAKIQAVRRAAALRREQFEREEKARLAREEAEILNAASLTKSKEKEQEAKKKERDPPASWQYGYNSVGIDPYSRYVPKGTVPRGYASEDHLPPGYGKYANRPPGY